MYLFSWINSKSRPDARLVPVCAIKVGLVSCHFDIVKVQVRLASISTTVFVPINVHFWMNVHLHLERKWANMKWIIYRQILYSSKFLQFGLWLSKSMKTVLYLKYERVGWGGSSFFASITLRSEVFNYFSVRPIGHGLLPSYLRLHLCQASLHAWLLTRARSTALYHVSTIYADTADAVLHIRPIIPLQMLDLDADSVQKLKT